MKPGNSGPPELSIAVIGGGIIGTSIAWRLAQRGWEVTLFEKRSLGSEASWAGAGMLSPGGEIESWSPLATLAIESRQLYASFVRELENVSGLAIDYQECGGLDLAYSPDELETLEHRAARQAAVGIRSKALLGTDVFTFWPKIRNRNLLGARFYSGDAIVNPREMVIALADACQKSNARIVQNCSVFQAEISSGSVTLRTGEGIQTFAAAVIAAGAWSGSIVIEGTPPLPDSEPIKGHLIGYQQPEQTCNTIVRHGHTYLLQRANGLLIAGASVEHAGFDRSIHAEVVDSLCRNAEFVLPHLAGTSPSETWIGFRPGSETPRIGSWHSQRLYLAYGHYRNGILLAPITAERIAAEINANLGIR